MSDPLTIVQGDALSSLRRLPDESVQTCVTSPPYWSLRDYGLDPIVWDATVECEHEWGASVPGSNRGGSGPNGKNGHGEEYGRDAERGSFCHCGAWRGCLGLEPTPDLYVSHLVQIFRELKRVLHGHGVLWLNLGDSYFGDSPTRKASSEAFSKQWNPADSAGNGGGRRSAARVGTLKPKDLCMMPARVALALQADGWYLRCDIIWAKKNCMPESVTDRPTRSHEYVFLFSKPERYFYNADAIKEPAQLWTGQAATFERSGPVSEHVLPGQTAAQHRSVRTVKQEGKNSRINISRDPAHEREYNGKNRREDDQWSGRRMLKNARQAREETGSHDAPFGAMRNKRSVWTVATRAFPEAHFATFPADLITPCILAGSRPRDVVLDPFSGSGTTAKVAIELGRNAIAIEPKAEYVEMIKRRCQTTIGLPITA